jgi:hypothetical protein
MTYDSATWGAFACTLSILAGLLTWRAYVKRGVAALVRGAGWTLLPIAAWMTGTLHLLADVLGDVGHWATRLVFSPVVWIGIILAAVAVMLIGVGGLLGSRGVDGAGDGAEKPVRRKSKNSALPGATTDNEFAEIEEILRRRGIS